MGIFSAAVISCSWEGMGGHSTFQPCDSKLRLFIETDIMRPSPPKEPRWNFITSFISKSHAAYTMWQILL